MRPAFLSTTQLPYDGLLQSPERFADVLRETDMDVLSEVLKVVKLQVQTEGSKALRSGTLAKCRSLFAVTPPMCCLDIVWVVVSPSTTHPFRISMVGHDIVVVGEFFMADRANTTLLSDLAAQQFAHLGW